MAGKNTKHKDNNTLEKFGVGKKEEELLEKKMRNALKEIGEDIKLQIKKQQEEFMQEFFKKLEMKEQEWKEERETWKEERETWKKEKDELSERVKRLEWEKEKVEREKRKLNIIIKGKEFTEDNTEKMEEKIERFLKNDLNEEVKVVNAYLLKKERNENKGKIVLVKLEDWKMKRQIMSKKKNLKKDVYIDDDLTNIERKVQQEVRKLAKEEREKGKNTKVGYMKVQVEGKWIRWDEWRECFIEEVDRRKD